MVAPQRSITAALLHAFLELTLIAALLLNGVFAFFIAKFAAFFRLQPPCVLCSRVDCLCRAHATELRKTPVAEATELPDDTDAKGEAAEMSSHCSWCKDFDDESCYGEAFADVAARKEEKFFDDERLVPVELLDEMTVVDAVDIVKLDKDGSSEEDGVDTPAIDIRVIVEEKMLVGIDAPVGENPKAPAIGGLSDHNAAIAPMQDLINLDEPKAEEDVHQSQLQMMMMILQAPSAEEENLRNAFLEEEDSIKFLEGSVDMETSSEVSIGSEIRGQSTALGSSCSDYGGRRELVDQLRSALAALHAELEAERSAAAIAASQTMAMIGRLQEEKAAMMMEALQYQRVMEEQSEYDQEALRMLNELVAKREREKRLLESELDVYKHRALLHESKARRRDAGYDVRSAEDDGEEADEESSEFSGHGERLFMVDDELKALEEMLVAIGDRSFESSTPASDCAGETDRGAGSGCRGVTLLPLLEAAGADDDGDELREDDAPYPD